jgi:hypothetical protein
VVLNKINIAKILGFLLIHESCYIIGVKWLVFTGNSPFISCFCVWSYELATLSHVTCYHCHLFWLLNSNYASFVQRMEIFCLFVIFIGEISSLAHFRCFYSFHLYFNQCSDKFFVFLFFFL